MKLHRSSECAPAGFGRVTEGMDVVDKIRLVKTGSKGMFDSDAPEVDVVIKSIKRVESPK